MVVADVKDDINKEIVVNNFMISKEKSHFAQVGARVTSVVIYLVVLVQCCSLSPQATSKWLMSCWLDSHCQ